MKSTPKFFILFFIIILFSSGIVSAEIFSTIAMQGLSFVNPQIAGSVGKVLSMMDPVSWVGGQIKGIISQKAMEAIANIPNAGSKIVKAIQTYNQVQGYIGQGAQIANELGVNENGEVKKGTINFTNNESNFGNLVGVNISAENISGRNIQFNKINNLSVITFIGENASLKIKGNSFENIRPKDNLREASITLDEKGAITNADFWTNEKGGSYVFGNDRVPVPANSHITYSDKKFTITAADNSEFKELPSRIENPDNSLTSNQIILTGKNIHLPNGNILNSGSLLFENGNSYISTYQKWGSEFLSIDGIEFRSTYKVRVFFDGNAHTDISENYISLNANEKRMHLLANEGTGFLEFKKDNPFLRFDNENSHFKIDTVLGPRDGKLELEISNPNSENLPKLKIINLGRGFIENGKFSFEPGYKILFKSSDSPSVPIIFSVKDDPSILAGNDVVMNSNNEYEIIHYIEDSPFFNTLRFKQKDPQKIEAITILKNTGIIPEYRNLEMLPASDIADLYLSLNELPPELTQYTQSIEIMETDIFSKNNYARGRAGYDGTVYLRKDGVTSNVIIHEIAHEFNFNNPDFVKEWAKIHNGRYNYNYEFTNNYALKNERYMSRWNDGGREPREDFVNPYSYNCRSEHMAETITQVNIENPQTILSMTNPDNPEYDPRIAEYIKLMNRYGIISESAKKTFASILN